MIPDCWSRMAVTSYVISRCVRLNTLSMVLQQSTMPLTTWANRMLPVLSSESILATACWLMVTLRLRSVGDAKQSVLGYVVHLNGTPLHWGSLKQTIEIHRVCLLHRVLWSMWQRALPAGCYSMLKI